MQGDPSTLPVEQTVVERIDRDSRRLGESSDHLVAIQESIRTVEHEVLSKVFDMASLKAFYEKHAAEVDERQRLEGQRAQLVGKVSALAQQLNEAQAQYNRQEQAYAEEAKRLRGQIEGKKEAMPAVLNEVEVAKVTHQECFALEDANEKLRKQNEQSVANLEAVMQALERDRLELARRRKQTQVLEDALATQKKYETKCDSATEKMEQQVNATEAAVAQAEQAVHVVQTKGAQVQQAIIAQNTQYKARLGKAKANLATIQSQIVVANDQHAALQMHGEEQLEKLRGHLGMLREHLAELQNDLTSTVQARQAVEHEIRMFTKEVEVLERRLLSGELAALEANNTRLRHALSEAHGHSQVSQAQMAQAHANVSRGNLTLTHLRQVTEDNNALASEVARRYLAKIVARKSRAKEASEAAEEKAMLAQSTQPTDCGPMWDKQHPEVIEELKTCETLEQDLAAADAEISSLSALTNAGG